MKIAKKMALDWDEKEETRMKFGLRRVDLHCTACIRIGMTLGHSWTK